METYKIKTAATASREICVEVSDGFNYIDKLGIEPAEVNFNWELLDAQITQSDLATCVEKLYKIPTSDAQNFLQTIFERDYPFSSVRTTHTVTKVQKINKYFKKYQGKITGFVMLFSYDCAEDTFEILLPNFFNLSTKIKNFKILKNDKSDLAFLDKSLWDSILTTEIK